ncbi:MAG TPA: hypothetical protein VFP34_18170 [Microlunatus sp.]|nr:hypothetical protein [Microlunatus sp.]
MSASTRGAIRKAIIGGAAAAAVALPLALVASPAQAATSLNGCTVTPLAPVRVGTTATGVPIVRYSTRVTCVKDRIIQIRDQRFEADAPAGVTGDDSYGSTTYLRTFAAGATITLSTNDLVTNTELGNEETYHRTSFRVATIAGASGWTAFENSALLSVAI